MSSTPLVRSDLEFPAAGQAWAVFASTTAEASKALQTIEALATATGLHCEQLSLRSQQAFYEDELLKDDTDYLDRQDTGTVGLNVLLQSGKTESLCRQAAEGAGITSLLTRGYRLLSTGECRMLLLVREVLKAPELLLIEQPFEGLDAQWRNTCERLFSQLLQAGKRLVIAVERIADLPRCTQRSLVIHGTQPVLAFDPTDTSQLRQLLSLRDAQFNPQALTLPPPRTSKPLPKPLVAMRDCAVRYLDDQGQPVTQFEGLNWQLNQGEHTLVVGPNGAGKSTLLQLLSGDHPQSYGNDLRLFGYQRGSGESVWDIKRNVGLVSPSLHRDYRVSGNLLSVVVSGLYDSIGVYRQIPDADQRLAQRWLKVIGLAERAQDSFARLSFSQQRLVLIARGLIKHPPLLILDEPTQGLDERGRQLVLAFLPLLARLQRTTLLMVTHREDEQVPLFQRKLRFEPVHDTSIRYRIVVSCDSSQEKMTVQ